MSTSTESDSTDSGGSVTVTGTLTTNNGGDLTIDPENPMEAPGALDVTDYGVTFGPLELIAYPGSTARIGGLKFLAKTGFFDGLFGSDEGGLFGAAGLLAVTNRDETLGRRNALKAVGALGLVAGGVAANARAATETRTQATFSLTSNPGGLRVRVRDRTPDYLPTSTAYYIYVNSAEYSQFSAANAESYGDVLPELTGTVVVGPRDSGGSILERLTADKARSYDGLTLTDSSESVVDDVAGVAAGTELTVTNNDVMVEAAQAAGSSETTLAINGTSIPHRHESTESSVGRYLFQDGEIRYVVGSNPPSGQTASLSLYVGRTTELLDDFSRRTT